MGIEIERKFLVTNDEWRGVASSGLVYQQGYLANTGKSSIRARIADKQAWLTVKSAAPDKSRLEFEYEIPLKDAEQLLSEFCVTALIEKTRYRVEFDGAIWEIDVFHGDSRGLVIAEVELPEKGDQVALPSWVGEEVTGDKRYYNADLARHPFTKW